MEMIIDLVPAKSGDIQSSKCREMLGKRFEIDYQVQWMHFQERIALGKDCIMIFLGIGFQMMCHLPKKWGHSSSHNGSASKRPVISSTRPNSSGEPSEIRSSQLVSSSEDEEESDSDEYYDYDDGEDEEMWLVREKTKQKELLRQQEVDANNVKKGTGANSEVSNNGKMSNATSDSIPKSTDPPTNDPTSLPSSGGSHVETDKRKVISVDAICNPRRFVPQSVTRDIISSVITRMPAPVDLWKNYPVRVKDELFLDFMGKYKFASDYDRSMARTVWERTCMDRYPDHLKNARKMALKQVNSTNLADTKGHGPKGMKVEVWDGLVDIWLTPKWRKKSNANRSNRAALPDSVLHTAGSMSFGEHKRRMEAELKHPFSYRDVYDHVHKKKDGEYISQCSKNFIESHDTIMLEKYGEDSSMHPIIDSEVWAEVSGPKKKRQVLGGHSLDIDTHGSMDSSSSKVIGPSRTAAPTQEDIKEAVNIAMMSFVQTQLVPMLEPILSMIGGGRV